MVNHSSAASEFRFSTDQFPDRDRASVYREWLGRKVLGLEMEPLGSDPFHAEVLIRAFPELGIVQTRCAPFRLTRTRSLTADGNDSCLLVFNRSNLPMIADRRGSEIVIGAGDAALLSSADVGTTRTASDRGVQANIALQLPRSRLASAIADVDGAIMRRLPAQSEVLRLISLYVEMTLTCEPPASPELTEVAISHLYDLMALAFGASPNSEENARSGGVRAARIAALKRHVRANLGERSYSPRLAAESQRITTSYLHRLFEAESISFMDFVLQERLQRAHRLLADIRHHHRPISDIAFSVGFGDLSHFNRTFRRRFGETPTDVRERAMCQSDGR